VQEAHAAVDAQVAERARAAAVDEARTALAKELDLQRVAWQADAQRVLEAARAAWEKERASEEACARDNGTASTTRTAPGTEEGNLVARCDEADSIVPAAQQQRQGLPGSEGGQALPGVDPLRRALAALEEADRAHGHEVAQLRARAEEAEQAVAAARQTLGEAQAAADEVRQRAREREERLVVMAAEVSFACSACLLSWSMSLRGTGNRQSVHHHQAEGILPRLVARSLRFHCCYLRTGSTVATSEPTL